MSKAYDRVTETILKKLEEGVCPWRRPWNRFAKLPCNYQSRREYSGINLFLLYMVAHEMPWFLTFRQVKEMGGSVKKGSKGYPIAYWGNHDVEDKKNPEKTKSVPFLKSYTVFNASQVEGVDFPVPPQLNQIEFQAIRSAEQVVLRFPGRPEIHTGYQRACYIPATDTIQMPSPQSFLYPESYYATLFHELGHSSGHKDRLDRDLSGNFGDKSYGKEELIAEMTSAFLCAHCRIDNSTIDQSAAYLQGWIKAIEQERTKPRKSIRACLKRLSSLRLGSRQRIKTVVVPMTAYIRSLGPLRCLFTDEQVAFMKLSDVLLSPNDKVRYSDKMGVAFRVELVQFGYFNLHGDKEDK